MIKTVRCTSELGDILSYGQIFTNYVYLLFLAALIHSAGHATGNRSVLLLCC